MTAKDNWDRDKQDFANTFEAKVRTGYLFRGSTYNIEVPVDRTSKYTIPVDGIIMHLLDYKDEPEVVKNTLTGWKPRERRTSESDGGGSGGGTSNSNRNRAADENQVKSNKRVSYRQIWIELPFDTRFQYQQLGGTKTLRFVSMKCHPIISINSLLYLFSNNYFEKTPLSFRTVNSTWRIPGTAFPLDKFGELSNKMEAANQQTGDLPDTSTKGRGGGTRNFKKSANEGGTP